MADVTPERINLQAEEVAYRSAVSEILLTRVASSINFINDFQGQTLNFQLFGVYNLLMPNNNVDGIRSYKYNFEITQCKILAGSYNGSSGTTELDIKWKPQNSGAWVSIFSTTPKFTSAAASDSSCFGGQTVAGFTAPVLSKTLFDANDLLRIDIITAVVGDNLDFAGIELFTIPR